MLLHRRRRSPSRFQRVLLALALFSALGADAAPSARTALPGAPAFSPALEAQLAAAVASRPADFKVRSRHLEPDGAPIYTNRLALESSPYLLQHAHNPVNWYPWGPAAFTEARRRNVPVLLSIGYSTCHWCHVMEEESFDDPTTAALLNRKFVAIKVDRESRPDLDEIYMGAIHALGQRGGWPLNVWLTPDAQPFYGGTYFPPQDSRGRPGFRRVLETLSRDWQENPAGLAERAAEISQRLAAQLTPKRATGNSGPTAATLHRAARRALAKADPTYGGAAGRIKFPSGLPLGFLLRYHRRTGDTEALAIVTRSLEAMADGGLFDSAGGGFHRYSTDPEWRVPHFEKMLYDNALLASLYVEAAQATGRADFEAVAREVLDYLARELRSPGGGFYSATDADSLNLEGESEEGFYFTWTPGELEAVLGPGRAAIVGAALGVTPKGHVEGRSILHRAASSEEVAVRFGISGAEVDQILTDALGALYRARQARTPPGLDDKILAAWNGLAISAFAKAAFAFDDSSTLAVARRAANFVLRQMQKDGRLQRMHRRGRSSGPAFLEDYAFVVAGLLDLYEADSDPRWLREAVSLQEILDRHYADLEGGGFFRTADDHETLLVRSKPFRDGALPSGNAVSALNLLRLAGFIDDPTLAERAQQILAIRGAALDADPLGSGSSLVAADYLLDTPLEIMVVTPAGGSGDRLIAPLRSSFVPNRILSVVPEGAGFAAHAELVPLLGSKVARKDRATAYVCIDRVCSFPTTDPNELARQVREVTPLPVADPG
jgi:uncharacterized protein YyaL (SSP411 family)